MNKIDTRSTLLFLFSIHYTGNLTNCAALLAGPHLGFLIHVRYYSQKSFTKLSRYGFSLGSDLARAIISRSVLWPNGKNM
jgi:hypothetical protein